MAKSLEERVAERISREGPVNRRSQRAAFLALKDEIGRAINAGWPVKDIWKTLHGEDKIQVTYQAFVKYVNRFIRDVEAARLLPDKPVIPNKPDQRNPPLRGGFTINASPNKEDLV